MCVEISRCQAHCQSTLAHARGESGFTGRPHAIDRFDYCRLGCCMRSALNYDDCSNRCWYFARMEGKKAKSSSDGGRDATWKRCAEGCDFRCRWMRDEVGDPENCPADDSGNAKWMDLFSAGWTETNEELKLRQLLRAGVGNEVAAT